MTFTNSILSGNTLVRDAIQSEGFVSGSTGWSIERDGDAEFNDVTVRGTVIVSGPGGVIEINVDILGQPYIRLTAPNGDTYDIAADNDSLDIGFTNLAGRSSFHIADGSGLVMRSTATGAPSVLFDNTDGFLKRGTYSPFTITGWANASLQNGWNTTGVTAFDPPGYRLMPDGLVKLRGVMNNGTKTNGTLLFTLPVGMRPARRKEIDVTTDVAGNNQRIQIFGISDGANAGQVQIQGLGTGNTIGLDGKDFEVI